MSEMSGPSKRPDWLDPDPTADHELCICGSGYVVIGTLCGECEYKARLVELRKFYPPDEAEVRAIVDREYISRRVQARMQREVALPGTTIDAHLVRTQVDPRYFAGKMLQIWEVTATTGGDTEAWFVVGPDPWDPPYPALNVGSAEQALIYYRMTQRYDAEGWRLDPTTGKRGDKP
jgi:hypothetical protein